MEEAYILLLLFGGTAYAFLPPGDSICNGNQEKSHCSVTLGGSVYIQVMPNVTGHRVNCKKLLPSGPILVFAVKKEKLVIQKDFRSRTQFFINNGTLKISSVEKIDSGKYTVEVFDSSGHCVKIIEVELDVQENRFSILIPVCSALAALLVIVVLSCCVYKKMRCNRKSGSSKSRKKGSSKSRKKETTVEYWKTSDRMEDPFQHGLN